MFLLFWWLIVNLLIGAAIGTTKNRVVEAVLLALLIGPIGWLLVLVGPDYRRKCPFCAEPIQPEAKLCPHCRSRLTAPQVPPTIAPARPPPVLPPKPVTPELPKKEDPYDKWVREHPEKSEPN